jgi:hypothetical protein
MSLMQPPLYVFLGQFQHRCGLRGAHFFHVSQHHAAGNGKIIEALKASGKKDHLRIDVSGEVKGDTLEVTPVKLL